MVSAPMFVGREAEVAAVMRALADPPASVLVEGDAGIGKTRLVQECLAARSLRGRRVMTAVCPPLREPYPLGPACSRPARTGRKVLSRFRTSS